MFKNPRFWGKFFQIVLAPAVLGLGGLILDLDSSQDDKNKE